MFSLDCMIQMRKMAQENDYLWKRDQEEVAAGKGEGEEVWVVEVKWCY